MLGSVQLDHDASVAPQQIDAGHQPKRACRDRLIEFEERTQLGILQAA
jgi:hypothetical protein